jgi:hypothetical protein
MTSTESLHELLPWYVTGTLEAEELAAFREHLAGCPTCREEMGFLTEVREAFERHGEALLEPHPPAETVVAFARGDLGGDDGVQMRRHLVLCAACATEARWARDGAAVEREAPAAEPSRPTPESGSGAARPWKWATAIAATIAGVALALPLLQGPSGPRSGVVRPVTVRPPERSAGGRNALALAPHEDRVLLLLGVDFPAESFPLALEITDRSGRRVHAERGIGRDLVLQDTHLFVELLRRDVPPGAYTARIRAEGGGASDMTYEFDVVERPQPGSAR